MIPRLPIDRATASRRLWIVGLCYAVLWIGCWHSAGILDLLGVASLWFLPAGLRFSVMLALGWPGVAIEFATQSAFALLQTKPWSGTPFGEIFSWPTFWRLYEFYGSATSATALLLPLRRWLRGPIDFCEPSHTVGFLATALISCALTALAGTYGLIKLGNIAASDFADVWPAWLIGDFVAIVTLTPLLLARAWPPLKRYIECGTLRRHPEAQPAPVNDRDTALVAALSLALLYGIGRSFDVNPHFPLITLLLLLPVAGIALRFGLRSALFAVALLDAGLVVLLAFLDAGGDALQYQIVIIAIAFCGLWLGAMADVRRRLINRYRDFASVSNDLLWETDTQGRLHEIGGRLAKQISLSPG